MGRRLIMHPPKSSGIPIEGDTALHNFRIQSPPGKLMAAEGAAEKAPIILQALHFNNKGPRQSRFREDHGNRPLTPFFLPFPEPSA
jgi:hypothetical protein